MPSADMMDHSGMSVKCAAQIENAAIKSVKQALIASEWESV